MYNYKLCTYIFNADWTKGIMKLNFKITRRLMLKMFLLLYLYVPFLCVHTFFLIQKPINKTIAYQHIIFHFIHQLAQNIHTFIINNKHFINIFLNKFFICSNYYLNTFSSNMLNKITFLFMSIFITSL